MIKTILKLSRNVGCIAILLNLYWAVSQAQETLPSLTPNRDLSAVQKYSGKESPTASQEKKSPAQVELVQSQPMASVDIEPRFISKVRQLTFDGKRAGEGYFSRDGRYMVFQSERDASNPFYQIYLMDRETGDEERISVGFGKTTCAWIHANNRDVLFASTQFDPDAKEKQKEELEFRASGQTRRYSWDYDPTYEIVVYNRESKKYKRLTRSEGYDAEGSYSPDGNTIVFASNRRAYNGSLTPADQELFKTDPASAMDIYTMHKDGSRVRRITDVTGYDGGPFFSPDGYQICWRRFTPDGTQAEIYVCDSDGLNAKALTKLNAMSWAPFYHPSGDYLIFTTNIQGFANFELYAVDKDGEHEPVRVTSTDGFDGLPVFTPDGQSLVWTSTRTDDKKSQLFTATWNDQAVREALKISTDKTKALAENVSTMAVKKISIETNKFDPNESERIALENKQSSRIDFQAEDIGRHVDYLCRPELGGRLTGTAGELQATAYVAAYMEDLGLAPAGEDNSYFQAFPFVSGVDLGLENSLKLGDQEFDLDEDWRPIVFSKTGPIEPANVVFAGYGIVAPKDAKQDDYDSYVHLDVENKWVMVFRQLPIDVTPERRQHLARYGSLRYKALVARERGARGLIVVSGPTSKVRQQLVPLQTDGALSGSSLAAISVSDELATQWLATANEDLEEFQKELDKGEMMMGIDLPQVTLSANIDIDQIDLEGRNVLGVLKADIKNNPKHSAIIVGAHIDHLGAGGGGNSLAKDDERGGIHRGADDNASGVAAMLEIAQYLTDQVAQSKVELKHDIVFAAWSGEELGLIGSGFYADHFYDLRPALKDESAADDKLYPAIAACINLDMVGRLKDKLVLQGIGSSPIWTKTIEQRNVVVGLDLVLQNDTYLPTDASTFYLKGVPILSAFTGQHSEYHTPRDIPELLNYEGAASISRLVGMITRSIASESTPPEFVQQTAPENSGTRAALTAYLGTIPDYVQSNIKGVLLSGVAEKGPASVAGVKAKDIIIELAGRKIENIYDYTYAIEALKVGEETEIVVMREDQEMRLKITPLSRT